MAYNGATAIRLPRHIEATDGVESMTITTNLELTYSSAQYLLLKNVTGALNCTLPAHRSGGYFWILNRSSSSHSITVNRPDGGGGAATLAAGECGLFVCDGIIWELMIKA
tara:strand:+ start:2851 stop:3180 length:330 start_codon:yes stop_codon:yes gene_type:complete